MTLPIILIFSLIGIAGSYGVAWFGIRVNTFANSRAAFASLRGKPFPIYAIPLRAGMSIGMLLISVELFLMLCILLFIPGDYAGPCFIGFAIGESLGAAALRIAGGIFTKIADIGSDLMKIVFNIKEDDARNPGVIADCTGDNAGDSVGPSADGFETYGVTGVALISFILLAVPRPAGAGPAARLDLRDAHHDDRRQRPVLLRQRGDGEEQYGNVDKMNFEAPLTTLVWLTSIVSVVITYIVSYLLIPDLGDGSLWWKLSTVITCGTLAGAIIPEFVKVFTSTESAHVQGSRDLVARRRRVAEYPVRASSPATSAPTGSASASSTLMGIAYYVSTLSASSAADAGAGGVRLRPGGVRLPRHGPGHHCGRLLRSGDRQRAVGVRAVGHREHSRHQGELKREYGFDVKFERAKDLLEENDGAGNTFKATAKPVLIGTAVVGATTMIFSIIVSLTDGLTREPRQAVAAAPAVPARADHGRGGDLLVHRRVRAGRHDRRVPRGRVHQGEHQARWRPRRRRWRTARRSSRSARSMRRRGCSTSS